MLKCANTEVELIYFCQDPPALDVISVRARLFPVKDIAPGINLNTRKELELYEVLKKDILENGMINGIVIVANKEETLKNGLKHLPEEYQIDFDSSKPWLCLFGNQRLQIALEEGYDEIDAYYLASVDRAIILGKKLEGVICS